jgi:hypothetical protein
MASFWNIDLYVLIDQPEEEYWNIKLRDIM